MYIIRIVLYLYNIYIIYKHRCILLENKLCLNEICIILFTTFMFLLKITILRKN